MHQRWMAGKLIHVRNALCARSRSHMVVPTCAAVLHQLKLAIRRHKGHHLRHQENETQGEGWVGQAWRRGACWLAGCPLPHSSQAGARSRQCQHQAKGRAS